MLVVGEFKFQANPWTKKVQLKLRALKRLEIENVHERVLNTAEGRKGGGGSTGSGLYKDKSVFILERSELVKNKNKKQVQFIWLSEHYHPTV